jgi:radical SAM superfamily enzyme YgiQ (UPF0313 family)
MPKLMFVQPSQYSATGRLIKQKRLYMPGLVFPLLAAMTPPRWEIDARIEILDDVDLDTDADLIGIGAMGHSIFRAFELADEFRRRGKTVVMGGYQTSLATAEALKHADGIIIGDAEISYPLLLRDFEETGKVRRVYDFPVRDLAGLPVPRYEILTAKSIGPMLPVQAARGCPNTCSFCSIYCLYRGRYLVRPIDEVIRDIRRVRELGCRAFYLIDDNIAGSPAYLEELCRRIEPLKMSWATQCTMNLARDERLLRLVARSGCRILSLGVEGVTQEGLDRLNKAWLKVEDHVRLLRAYRQAGILASAEMMVGLDSDTEESLRETYRFITRTKLPLLRIYMMTPVPGSPLYEDYRAKGRLLHEDHTQFTTAKCVHYPERISPERLTEIYAWLNRKVFSLSHIVRRTLLNPGILRRPRRYFEAFAVNLHYRRSVRRGDAPLIV